MNTESAASDPLWRAIANADLEMLNASERTAYYSTVCESLGLNPLTRPLEYIELNGKLTLYAKRDATDQLRRMHHVSVEIVDRAVHDEVYIVRARATLPDGRADESLGAVNIGGLDGTDLGNALMTAETKAKRRVTLSICGLGFLDETEVAALSRQSGGPRWPRRSAPVDPVPTAATVLQAWDRQGTADRLELYAHVKQQYGKRVVALSTPEATEVLAWIHERQAPDAPREDASDVA
jgi:hypothetical protein